MAKNVKIDPRGYVFVEGVKVCRVERNGTIYFHDRHKKRCAQRGSQEVSVSIEILAQAVKGDGDV